MKLNIALLGAFLGISTVLGAMDLSSAKKEPDPEKRFEKALDVAEEALKEARTLPAAGGSIDDLEKDMTTMVGGIELSLQSLHDTGKRPNKLERFYKRGEMRTREMLRQLQNLIQAIAFESRPPAEKAQGRLNEMHEEFLLGVMGGK
jgi:hypothetical protein